MWPFNIFKLKKRIRELENFNKHLQEANRHLFELFQRERYDIDAHTQDCRDEYLKGLGIEHDAIKDAQQYYEWVWHSITFLNLVEAAKEHEACKRKMMEDLINEVDDDIQRSDSGDN